ncbi:DUF4270 domain-containing protein [Zobellia uliginosa]|uniref:DUF4270 domain-containing protein n=1 Tax=Zobellia uliginosa TaxID=143224 RepID=UPI001C0783C0|nr:DUF4270 domain-containing protein [Zobellia uliginosa]MBU2948549.1 DUF4270 family protein [Zobellia uliginosa]
MIFLNRLKLPALAVLIFATIFTSCEEDLTTVGSGVVGGEPFKNDKAVFDVFAYNKKIKAVATNKLPIYQLGVYEDPLYGRTEAKVTTQVLLPSDNPTFGSYSQEQEETENADVAAQIPENETVESVYLYIPFLTNPTGDADGDGLIDELDDKPLDPNSDTDGGGLTDAQENTRGSNPLDETDDSDDAGFVANQFAKTFDLDSIYTNSRLYDKATDENLTFNLKVQRSTFFMRDLDPNANFQEAQEYYSNQDLASNFFGETIYDSATGNPLSISSDQIAVAKQDDETTEDVNESTQFNYLSPGIRVELDKAFFQENIIDKEGSTELSSQTNFKEFLRGLHFTLSEGSQDLMFLFNLKAANITVTYKYDSADTDGVVSPQSKQKDLVLNFLSDSFSSTTGQLTSTDGNAANTFINESYPVEIMDNLDTEENASKIYLKGGAGSFAEIKLFDEINSSTVIKEIKANNWIINNANLVFYIADDNLGAEPQKLYLYNTETNTSLPLSATDATGQLAEYDGALTTSTAGKGIKYSVDVTTYINGLVLDDGENVTLGLTTTPNLFLATNSSAMLENGDEQLLPVANTLSPLGTVLYGSAVDAANADKKLQLEIFYTETN